MTTATIRRHDDEELSPFDDAAPFDDAPMPEPRPLRRSRRKRREVTAGDPIDMDAARRFAAQLEAEALFAPGRGWHRWDGSRFARDELRSVAELAKDQVDALRIRAAAINDEDLFKLARRLGTAKGIRDLLELAQSDPRLAVRPADLDADPWLLNCRNGTLDLRDGRLRPHARADRITRLCPVDFDADARAPRFERFLAEVQPDAEVRAYLARLFGYAAVGLVREHVMGVLWGAGANGKSVLSDVVMHVLGDHARPGASSLIVGAGYQPHPTDVAALAGTRLCVVHETNRGASFDSSKIKMLTGGDKITARFMRGDFFDFEPSHTLVMLSNYRPKADASDGGLWRRVQLVPFAVTIPEERRDVHLADRIRADEAAGVLRWIVEGCVDWQRRGLDPPAAVREQTAAYRASEDGVAAFLEEQCTVGAGLQTKSSALYGAFRAWCAESGMDCISSRDFAAELEGRGFTKKKRASGMWWLGVAPGADEEGGRDAYRD